MHPTPPPPFACKKVLSCCGTPPLPPPPPSLPTLSARKVPVVLSWFVMLWRFRSCRGSRGFCLSVVEVVVLRPRCRSMVAVWSDERSAGYMKRSRSLAPLDGTVSRPLRGRAPLSRVTPTGSYQVRPQLSNFGACAASGGFPVPLVTTSAQELPPLQVAGKPSLGSQDGAEQIYRS